MSWYLRKSFGFGPFRINLSKSGLGYSFGVKGARIGVGPRGSYVHMGRDGVYYRQSLHSPTPSPAQPASISPPDVATIPTADAAALKDSSAEALLTEIREKHAKTSFSVPGLLILSFLLLAMIGLGAPMWVDGVIVICAIGSFLSLRGFDKERKTVHLHYHIEDDARRRYDALVSAFETLARSQRVWRVASQNLADPKYNAGAGKTVTRQLARLSQTAPPFVETTVKPWRLGLGKQDLYFFPDRILIYEGSQVGAVRYSDIRVAFEATQFIEDSSPPGDAKVVGQTWRYVNKSGGPDRRFASNPVLPIALYESVQLSSVTGMNFLLQVSNLEYGQRFAVLLENYANGGSSARGDTAHAERSDGQRQAGPAIRRQAGTQRKPAYEILGVRPGATPEEITDAYHHMAQMYHPDKVAGLGVEFRELAEKRMKEINAAYEELKHQAT